jgi:hypothetical protein
MSKTQYDRKIEVLAKIAHEANKAYCETQGDTSQASWDDIDEEHKDSARDGVRRILNDPNTTPQDSHQNWMDCKKSQGWTYGETKCQDKKTHPSMKPYVELSSVEKFKDALFHAIVKSYIDYIVK